MFALGAIHGNSSDEDDTLHLRTEKRLFREQYSPLHLPKNSIVLTNQLLWTFSGKLKIIWTPVFE